MSRRILFFLAAIAALSPAPLLGQARDADSRAYRVGLARPGIYPAPELRSPEEAQRVAIAGTAGGLILGYFLATHDANDAGTAVGFAAVLAGPSAGHFYGGLPIRGLVGAGVRVAGAGIAAAFGRDCDPFYGGRCGAIAFGAVLVLTSAVYDLVTVEADVRDHNQRIRQRVGLAPWIPTEVGGVGVAIRASF